MQPIAQELEDKGFSYFIVAQGTPDERSFLAPTGLPVLLDPEGKAFQAYRISAIPQTFFVDGRGVIDTAVLGWDGDVGKVKAITDRLTGR